MNIKKEYEKNIKKEYEKKYEKKNMKKKLSIKKKMKNEGEETKICFLHSGEEIININCDSLILFNTLSRITDSSI